MEMVRIFDTTLRDGEQAPGFSMNTAEKLRLARQLESLGVDVIEAGFPIASKGDFEAVRAVARAVRHSTVAGLVASAAGGHRSGAGRAGGRGAAASAHVPGDFGPAPEAQAAHFAGGSARIHRQDGGVRAVAVPGGGVFGRGCQPQRSRISGEGVYDCGRCGRDDPERAGHGGVRDAGGVWRDCFARCAANVSDRPGVVWSAHCHNDLGLAVANSLAAVEAGARQVECTINGIGERAGNAALEEIAVALAVRPDRYQAETRLQLNELYATSRLLSEITARVGAAEQGRGGRERVRARGGHSSGRDPEESADVSGDFAGSGGSFRAPAGAGKAFRAQRAARAAGGTGGTLSDDELARCYRLVMALADVKKD